MRFHLEDITVKGAWTGPAALDLYSDALTPVAELPVLQVLSAKHFVADLTLGLGTVVHDYLARLPLRAEPGDRRRAVRCAAGDLVNFHLAGRTRSSVRPPLCGSGAGW